MANINITSTTYSYIIFKGFALKAFEVKTQEFTGNNSVKEKQSIYNNTYGQPTS